MRARAAMAAAGLLIGVGVASAAAQGPPVIRTRLPNGLTVLVRENAIAPVVGISLMVKMGTRWETVGNVGISNLVQLMAVRGTPTRNGTQIVEAADAMGGSIEATGVPNVAAMPAAAPATSSVLRSAFERLKNCANSEPNAPPVMMIGPSAPNGPPVPIEIADESGLSSATLGWMRLRPIRIASIASGMPWPRIFSEP